MKTHSLLRVRPMPMFGQRGVILFIALVALLAMSLAAVALIRSVDTSTIIAGNLAFKQSATRSGDSGITAAAIWMENIQAATVGINLLNDPTHPFNLTCLEVRAPGTLSATDPGCAAVVPGYHSSIDPALDLTAEATWNDTNSVLVADDGSGNTTRYLIQRMCRNANQPVQSAGCLYIASPNTTGSFRIKLPPHICKPEPGSPCPPNGQMPQNRFTARTTGPRNTVSYVQTFVD